MMSLANMVATTPKTTIETMVQNRTVSQYFARFIRPLKLKSMEAKFIAHPPLQSAGCAAIRAA